MNLPSVIGSILLHLDRLSDGSLDPKKHWLWKIFGDGDPHSKIFHPVRESLLSSAQLNPVLSFKPSIVGLLILEVERKPFLSSLISHMAGERQGWNAMEIFDFKTRLLFGTKKSSHFPPWGFPGPVPAQPSPAHSLAAAAGLWRA